MRFHDFTAAARRFAWCLLVPALLLSAAGCDNDDPPTGPVTCTAEYVAGVSVEVRDATTGSGLACGATLYVTDGGYAEENPGICVEGVDYAFLPGAWERPGIYDLRVEKPGYLTWETAGVVVTGDECHVHTVRFKVDLQPVK